MFSDRAKKELLTTKENKQKAKLRYRVAIANYRKSTCPRKTVLYAKHHYFRAKHIYKLEKSAYAKVTKQRVKGNIAYIPREYVPPLPFYMKTWRIPKLKDK